MDFLVFVAIVVLVLGATRWWSVRLRNRSREEHAEVATTGRGAWKGQLHEHDVDGFFPEVRIGFLRSVFLMDDQVPVRLELSPEGLRLLLRGKRYAGAEWTAPWDEVLGATEEPAGLMTLAGKYALVRQTDGRTPA